MIVRPRVVVVATAIAGLVTGVVVTLIVTDPTDDAAGTAPRTSVTLPAPPDATAPDPPRATSGDADGTPSTVLLAWVSGGLPDELVNTVATVDVLDRVAVVSGDPTHLVRSARADGTVVDDLDAGWVVPLDTIAVDPPAFGAFVAPAARPTVESLRPGGALVTEASLALRRLDVGSVIELDRGRVEIVGVVDDVSGAGSELIIHRDDADRLGVATPRYLLVDHPAGQREAASQAIADLAGHDSVRFRTPTETTWLRHGDAVAPQVFVKATFGEFSFRDAPGRSVEIHPDWVEDHIVEATIPILGDVRCHRDIIEPLTGALSSLAEQNLSHLVDPAGYAGCWSARRIDGARSLSRHSWGIAVDLNIGANPRGSFSTQDPRLVEAMRDAGFTWGGLWLVPDPGHYELVPAP